MNIPYKFHRDCSSHSWDIVVTTSVQKNKRTDKMTNANAVDGQPKNIMLLSGDKDVKRTNQSGASAVIS